MSNDDSSEIPTPQGRRRRGLDGRVIAGRYEVTRTLAAGANTLIADATDRQLDRPVTIKLVRPELAESEEFRDAFVAEMETVAALSHPHLAAIYDWGTEQIGKRTTVYIVAEDLAGGSLRDLFDRGRMLTPSQALMVGLEACRGLDHAHRNGLVHAELTPSKIVFGDDRRLRIVDFGLARMLSEKAWNDPSQLPTHVATYASPEQAQGDDVTAMTDIYSLALILVEAVTGEVPFSGGSTVATLSARIGRLMPVSADLGPLAAVLERAGRPEPDERFSAAEFGKALVRAAERMPRPTPIPILTPAIVEPDPFTIRRPDDPTGGIDRPPDEPQPALVDADGKPAASTASSSVDGPPADTDSPSEPTARRGRRRGRPGDVPPPPAQRGAARGRRARQAVAGDPASISPLAAATGSADADVLTGDTASDDVRVEAGAERAIDSSDLAALVAGKDILPPPPSGAAAPMAAPSRSRWLTALFTFVLLAALAVLGFAAWKLFRTPSHEVPVLAGLTEQEALASVEEFGWDVDTDTTRDDDYPTPGEVAYTSPSAGTDLAEGSPLVLYISEGPEYRQLPDLAGMTLEDATASLEALQLVAGEPTRAFSDTVAQGRVISNSVEGVPVGDNVLPGATVQIVISRGPEPRPVPDVSNLTPDQAKRLLEQFGLEVTVGDAVFSDDVEAGRVAAQSPAAGEPLTPGQAVTVSPSKGPDVVALPDLSGMNLPQAIAALEDAGLEVGGLLGSTQGTFYAASVDGVEVAAGDNVRRGSRVDLILL